MSEAAPSAAPPDLLDRLREDGELRLGEIFVQRRADGAFALCHRADVSRADLQVCETVDAAAEIARYDDAGNYRALKTAPNLRHGWLLVLRAIEDVRLALDHFYPARLAAFTAWKSGTLRTTTFRDTLARQTGMYRTAAKITEQQADDLIARFCHSDGGCLRTILWRRDRDGTSPSTKLPQEKFDPAVDQTGRHEITAPLLCQESCNLLVAEARNVVKAAE